MWVGGVGGREWLSRGVTPDLQMREWMKLAKQRGRSGTT